MPDPAPPPPSLRSVTLTQLGYAVAVDTHRHFGAAAAACNVTQPTLSVQLGKLERALGVVLFDRSRAPVLPTDVGALIVAQARAVLREAARLGDVRDAAAGVVAGVLRLGVIPTLAPYLLPRMLPELQRRYPRMELVVEERLTDEIVDALRRDVLDAGIIASVPAAPDITDRLLFVEPFVAYVSAGHRLAARPSVRASDLLLDDLWLLNEGHCLRAQTVQLCRQRASRATAAASHRSPSSSSSSSSVDGGACTTGARFESGNLETLKRLVEGGMGMTLLPTLAADDLMTDAQRRLLRPFATDAPAREVRLVERRAHHKRHLLEPMLAVLLASLPAAVRPATSVRKSTRAR